MNMEINPSEYKVLIVDDVISNVLLLKVLLTNEKFKIVTAGNGTQALEQVKKENPDLVLLDVMMPDISGFEVAQQMKADPEMAADLFVQFLKESGTETSRENCVNDLARVQWITKDDWKDRELGLFARELGEFYVSLGQLEPTLIDKFPTNIVDTFVK